MATQLETFRIIAPEFASSPDQTVQNFLDLAPLFIDPMLYPEDKRGLALVLQSASLMYNQKQSTTGSSSGGQLVREKEGDLERQYGNASSSSSSTLKNMPRNIYLQQLDMMSLGVTGVGIMTRMNGDVPAL